MTTVTTVRGDILATELGYTTMHEHLNSDFRSLTKKQHNLYAMPEEMLRMEIDNLAFLRDAGFAFSAEAVTAGDVAYTAAELGYFRAVGGRAVCDATPIGARGDVRDLRAASEASDVHVLFATGLYVSAARSDELAALSSEQQLALFAAEAADGVDGTGLRPGLLKCAMSQDDPAGELRPEEVATLRALGRVSADTGLSLQVHTAFPMSTAQVLNVVEIALETGMQPDKLVMIHMDSFLRPWGALDSYLADMSESLNVSTELARSVLAYDVNIGFDSWGSTVSILPSDHDRVKGLADLLRDGFGSRIVLGHDNGTKPHGKSFGAYGFTRFGAFIPRLLTQLGFADDVFTQLVVDNPARILGR